jgi:3-hydroxybutyryl-CoA dehydrogenase
MRENMKIGIIGGGAMGGGIAQIAAQNGHLTIVVDANPTALERCQSGHRKTMDKLVEKGKLTSERAAEILGRLSYSGSLADLAGCGLVIEAIVESAEIKKSVFGETAAAVGPDCILATNTSSLSVTGLAASVQRPERFIGIHFFNPAPLMPLVEIIPALQTDSEIISQCKTLIDGWGKVTVLAKDTPGFIVNRVARPYYSEAIRIFEEGGASFAQIDAAMRSAGFRMGPFELMDFIGNDVNYAVTETVWRSMFFDPRYTPSFTQQKLSEAGRFGRKSGRGYYDYADGQGPEIAEVSDALSMSITERILLMLFNEAADALFKGIASKEDLDLAMTKGVNYPKGLLKWADEFSLEKVVSGLDALYHRYGEDRYRCCPLLRDKVEQGKTFYQLTQE